MKVFLTGATGFIGSYVTDRLLRSGTPVTVLIRAADEAAGRMRLWRSLQLHMPANLLRDYLERDMLRFVLGDVCKPRLGQSPAHYDELVAEHDTIVHTAATLNRRSPRACLDVNLRGGLELVKLARARDDHSGLRRFVFVSTVAVAGKRAHEVVTEDNAARFDLSDWDPYARTKKFAEHQVRELLPPGKFAIARPSIVLGDSRFPETTQFDMVRAFVGLARLPALPFASEARLDIVPANFVADALTALVLAESLHYDTYHLSAGTASPTFADIAASLHAAGLARTPRYVPALSRPAATLLSTLAELRRPKLLGGLRAAAALFDVFWPYLEWDVVFDASRVEREVGLRATPFPKYCAELMRFALRTNFQYPYRPFPPILADTHAGPWVGTTKTSPVRATC